MKVLREARRRWSATWVAGLVALALAPSLAHGDARSDYLIRLLQGSTQFRVRAQAAISLGSVEGAADVGQALGAALRDEHPAVRAAAANSLGRLMNPSALPALRAIASDPEPPVRVAVNEAIGKLEGIARRTGAVIPSGQPSGPPKYYVAVARPASKNPEVSSVELDRALQALRERLGQMDGVVLAPSGETPAAARDVMRARKLKGYYIDSSVTSVEPKPGGGTRVAVSVILATYPDRAMRAIMQGAATVTGDRNARGQAVASALKSAVSQVPQAMSRE